MLDGFPRTKTQAQDLDKILIKAGKPLQYILYSEASLSTVIQRLTGRRVCRNCGALFHVVNKPPQKANVCDVCGGELYQRADDNEETIKTRMDVYLKNLKPMLEYYRSKKLLKTISADQNSEEVHKVLLKMFDEDRKRNQH